MTPPTRAAPTLRLVEPNDPEYQRQLQAEAEFWDQPSLVSVDTELPATDAYWNERFTGDPATPWYDTVPRYGAFQRGCSLGTGGLKQNGRLLELCPALHLTIYDISEASLARFEQDLGARFPGRVSIERADLNFVQLPERGFDLIVSEGTLHHIVNLEHLAAQIDRALAPEGRFFLRDYVGGARFQFPEEQKRRFEDALAKAGTRDASLRGLRVDWPSPDPWSYSPFEAVRSDETLAVLRRRLSEVSVESAGQLVGLLLFVRPGEARRPGLLSRLLRRAGPADHMENLGRLAGRLLEADRALSGAPGLLPTNAFAVYRKKQKTAP